MTFSDFGGKLPYTESYDGARLAPAVHHFVPRCEQPAPSRHPNLSFGPEILLNSTL